MLQQMEAGRKVVELAREVGVSEATLYTWKSKYGGMEVSEARRPAVELERFSSRYKVGTGLQACPLQGRQECLPYLGAIQHRENRSSWVAGRSEIGQEKK